MMVKVITTELLQVNGFTFIITRPFQEFRKSITIGRRNLGGTGRHGRKNSVGRERQIVSRNPDLGAQSGRLSDWKKFFRLMKKNQLAKAFSDYSATDETADLQACGKPILLPEFAS
jgi:hypothetical protein